MSGLAAKHEHWLQGDGSGGEDYPYRIAEATRDALREIDRLTTRIADLEESLNFLADVVEARCEPRRAS